MPACSARLSELLHVFRRVPVGHVLAEELVEMGVAVDRVAAEDEPGHGVRTELDGRQGRLLGLRVGDRRRQCGHGGGQAGCLLEEITAVGGGYWTARTRD